MSPLPLAGKVALITGGSRGIGRAISIRLAASGATVVINYSSSSSEADAVVSQIGSNATAIKANAGSVSEIDRLVKETANKYGKIDILIACAGIMRLSELDALTEKDFDDTFNLNVKGPLFLAQKCAPHMAAGSRILLFSTSQAHASTVTPNYTSYIASKGAVEQLTRGLSKDLARKEIRVNCIAPGPTATDMFLNGKSEQLINTIANFSPMKRIGKPEEVAEIVESLCGKAGDWVTGQVLRVNGGMV